MVLVRGGAHKALRFIEIAGGLTFALAMAWFFLDEWRNRRRRQRKAERAMRALDGTPG